MALSWRRGLHTQSEDSFKDFVSGINYGDVFDFLKETNPSNSVYFINRDKINKESNTCLKEGEQMDFMSRIAYCHQNNIDIFMIIDEEQKNKNCCDGYVIKIQPKHVFRISATPLSSNLNIEKINDEEVIEAGLITKGISINSGLSEALEENNNLDDDLVLLKLADEKRKELDQEYRKLGLDIRTLVLVQFPSGKDEWIEKVKDKLAFMGYPESSGLVTSWFSGKHPDNPEEIKKNNGQYAFLLFKQAIATGWDCPRAKILVKLRENTTEQFEIQTIGRIRRMPERKHYNNNVLDYCYVYTLDSKFKTGLVAELKDSFFEYNYFKNLDLVKEDEPKLIKEVLDGNDTQLKEPQKVTNSIYNEVLNILNTNKDLELIREKLKEKGFVFGSKLKSESIEGVARTTNDIASLNKIFAGEHEVNTHDDGFIIRDAYRKYDQFLKIGDKDTYNILGTLFGPYKDPSLFSQEEIEFEDIHKLIVSENVKDYDAFLINNKDKLIDLLKDIDRTSWGDIIKADIKSSEWKIPDSQTYKVHKRRNIRFYLKKNVFKEYADNILESPNRSYGEITFEKWCEKNKNIKWFYKNGDKGDQYFSIVYEKGDLRANFYPDYIISTINNNIWIIEVKGGVDESGRSNNIDKQASNKFDALKKYCSNNNVKFGFVREDKGTLYISTTVWDEDLYNFDVWKDIDDII